jgi:radical SAM superfamily enzyme YgiQ (UPF0313 family)
LYRRDDRCQCKVEDQTVQITFPPIELASIGAVLRDSGARVRIRDYPAQGADWEDYRRDLKEYRPDFVLANVVTATAERDFQALELAKEELGDDAVLTAAKGEYMEALGVQALADHPRLDLGFHGEIERTLERYRLGAPPSELAGAVYRSANGAGVARAPGHPTVGELNELPWPARELLDNDLYRSPETGRPLTVIHGNRGCPAACVFCPAGVISGFTVRYRSPENIVGELRECVERFGIDEFLFHGDTFTMNKSWLLELCARIVDSGLKIRWGCNSRVDTIDDARAEAMKRAGGWVVAFGIETGSQELLDRMKKEATLADAERAVAVCKRAGLRVHAFFVIGLPWETERTLQETYAFARKLDTDFFDFNIAYPLPGTEFYEMAVADGLFERSPEETGYASAAVRTYELSSARLTEWRRRSLLSMYLRPSYIARTLARSGSPRVAMNYVRAGAKRLRQLVA